MNKKLLGIVLGKGAGEDGNIQVTGDVIHYSNVTHMTKISAYKLASLCKKEFIYYGSGYCITSFIDFDGTWFANVSGNIHKKSFQAETEYDAVFKSAQWCMDLENQNDKIEKDAELEEEYGKGN